MKTLVVFTVLSLFSLSSVIAGNPFNGDSASGESGKPLNYDEAVNGSSEFIQNELEEMNLNYRYIRAFERGEQTYFLYASDRLGETSYVLLGVDKTSGTSFTMGVDD